MPQPQMGVVELKPGDETPRETIWTSKGEVNPSTSKPASNSERPESKTVFNRERLKSKLASNSVD